MAQYLRRRSPSGAIADIRYDQKSQTLEITFQQYGSHTYENVPKQVADGLKRASSKGKYFNANIRNSY